jgi:hypothetical protein
MNAILGAIKVAAPYAEAQGYPMRTTVRNAPKWKKIETAAQRSLIWGPRKQIYSMSGRNMDSKSGDLSDLL